MNLSSLKPIIDKGNSFALIPHKNPDGDAIGSSLALAMTLKKMGKKSEILISGDFPKNLKFLCNDEFFNTNLDNFDTVILIDCADEFRISEKEKALFDSIDETVVIDHHITNVGFAKNNYINAIASATAEIIYAIITEVLGTELDKEIASCIYCGILCDTGSFKYSNTTPGTHIIASKLLEKGVEPDKLTKQAFDNVTLDQLKIHSAVINNLELYFNGKVAFTQISYKEINEHNLDFDEANHFVSLPRDIEGVEVGIFAKIKSDNEIKLSFRSNYYVDVAQIASEFGGGGHTKAAGCTLLNTNIEDVKNTILKRIESALND